MSAACWNGSTTRHWVRSSPPVLPLRLHGADRVKPVSSPSFGQHNMDIYHGWLGLPEAEVAALREQGVI